MWAFYVLGGLFIIFIIITIRIIKELNDQIDYLLEENERIRKATKTKSNIRLIEDGMNGNYTYLMYVFKETQQEDMYSDNSLGDVYVNNIGMACALNELQAAYPIFTDKELEIKNVRILSLFHCS